MTHQVKAQTDRALLFEPYDRQKRFAYVAKQILKKLQAGVLKPGDKLPSEEALARRMRVSRGSVREALIALQIAGVIERKQGNGTYVRNTATDHIRRALSLLKGSESPLEIWEAREGIELWVGQLVVKRRVAADSLEPLRNCFMRMRKAADRSIDEYLEANKSFHTCLAELTTNSVLAKIVGMLVELSHQRFLKELSARYSTHYIEESLEKHANIITALESGDQKQVESAIRGHFRKLRMYLERADEGSS